MRLIIRFEPQEDIAYSQIHNYLIQGFIYSLLKETEFEKLHDLKTFKFFCFSNVFPITDFKKFEEKMLIISSPNKYFIDCLYKRLKEVNEFKLGIYSFYLKGVKKIRNKLKLPWQTATPIVLNKGKEAFLYDENRNIVYRVFVRDIGILKKLGLKKVKIGVNKEKVKTLEKNLSTFDLEYLKNLKIIKIKDLYYSFQKEHNFTEWLEDLKRNSLIKYNLFFNKNFYFEEPIFEELKYDKEVCVDNIKIKGKGYARFIGTMWKKLNVLRKLDKEERMFYYFIQECGLGRLNSLGFGFVNPIK